MWPRTCPTSRSPRAAGRPPYAAALLIFKDLYLDKSTPRLSRTQGTQRSSERSGQKPVSGHSDGGRDRDASSAGERGKMKVEGIKVRTGRGSGHTGEIALARRYGSDARWSLPDERPQ